MHHMITDGWSMRILVRELRELYRSFVSGLPALLPELSIQYADFAKWQRKTLTDDVLRPHLDYWRARLQGSTPTLPLPGRYSPTAERTAQGRIRYLEISQEIAEGLRQISRQSGASLFLTLLAALQVLLGRYAASEDVVIGTPVAGRNAVELENLIGYFVNTLVMRTDLSGNPGFRELLRRTREVALEAYTHQDAPFEKIVHQLRAGSGSAGSSPVFEVMFVLHNSAAELELEGLRLEEMPVDAGSAKFPMTLEIVEGESLSCSLEYSTDLFEESAIQRLLDNFQRLLSGIVANPDCPIGHLPMLSDAEQRMLISEWNRTTAPYPAWPTIHSVFEAAAERTPDAPAFLCEQQRLTYRELNQQANPLAWYLIQRGLKPGTLVAILLERSLDVPVAMLAVMKAGAAYVPLDPTYPKQRLAYMLEHSGAPFIITHRGLKNRLPAHDLQVVALDADESILSRQNHENPAIPVPADAVAYIMYTSGSTGRPKGVCGTHRGSLNRFSWMSRTYPFASGEVTCQKTSLSFVDSIWEIFGPALDGVCVIIIPDEIVTSPESFVRVLAQHGVTRLVVVPSYLRLFLDAHDDLRSALPELRWCVASGEVLPPDVAQRFLQKLPGVRLLNLYGSSEVAADVTYFEVTSGGLTSIPIGRPIANTQIYVLDRHLQPVPVGAPGEIHVGGDSLSHGYWNAPELTVERFIPNPFNPDSAGRLFKTGDLGRFRPDGTLEFLGRADSQITIRGLRIEAGEIEAALRSYRLVREAAVIASAVIPSNDTGGDLQLVAHVVAHPGPKPSSVELRRHLRTMLPEHMVPSAMFVIDRLPLLPNGKVDRLQLSRTTQTSSVPDAVRTGPRNATEEQLAAIWQEVLNRNGLGIEDDFFDLGGDSLCGIQMFSRIRKIFQVELPLKALFEQPTISALAFEIERARANGLSPQEPLVASGRRTRAHLLAELDQLSAEEIDDLMATLSSARDLKNTAKTI